MSEPISASIGTSLAIKLLGGLGGAAISLAILLPKTMREAALRLIVGLMVAIMGGAPVAEYFGWGDKGLDFLLSACAIVSFASWWLLGAVARTMDGWKTVKDVATDIREIRK